jgi:glutathione S-transferase
VAVYLQVICEGSRLSCLKVLAVAVDCNSRWFGFSLDAYPRLKACLERLAMRESWQQTMPQPEVVEAALPNIRKF